MPIFEYTCKQCSSIFEVLVRSGGQPVRCPECGSESVSKLFSTFALRTSGTSETRSGSGCSTCSAKSCSTCR